MINRDEISPLRRSALRSFIPLLVSLAVIWLLKDRITAIDIPALLATLKAFAPGLWVTAVALSALSFYAIAQYDRIAAQVMGLPLTRRDALMSGWRATAISQVLGYGLITGALVRWRALGPRYGVSLWASSRMTALVAGCFFAGWAVITAAALLVAQPNGVPGTAIPVAGLTIALTVSALAAVLLANDGPLARLPSLSLTGPILFYTLLDTIAACAIIFIFLPTGYVDFLTLFSAFLIALAIGMTSGLPGGLGAFELSLIALLGLEEPAPLLSAILAYRAVYFAAPAVLAAATLLAQRQTPLPTLNKSPHRIIPHWLQETVPPEATLLAQDQLELSLSDRLGGALLTRRARHCDLVLGDPFGPSQNARTQVAARFADTALRPFCFYKCSDTLANWARVRGLITLNFSSEAIVKPSEFALEGAARRQLRRKLSRAQKAGLQIEPYFGFPDQLAPIDQAWQDRNGAAKRFSMGIFDSQLLAQERVWVAKIDGDPVAFISLMTSARKWTLDLIRMSDACPDGAIHSLVVAAIEAAREEGIAEFSLASAPFYTQDSTNRVASWLVRQIFARSRQLKGLHQFKASFAPDWRAEHFVANGLFAACFGMLDLYRLIHGHTGKTNPTHNHYGFYEFVSPRNLCHALWRMTQKDPAHEHAQRIAAEKRLASGRRRHRD